MSESMNEPGCSDCAGLLAIEAIKQLKYRYYRFLDTKQWDDFADCFVPEATADYAGLTFADRDELVTYMRDNMGPGLISMHTAHHPEIVVSDSGDEATGIWYLHDKVLVPDFNFSLEGAAFYEDRYVRTDQGWRILFTGYTRTYEVTTPLDAVPGLKVKNQLNPDAG